MQAWGLIMSAWRGAMTIVTLRYLYFGLHDVEISSHLSRSPTPTPASRELAQSATFDISDDVLQRINDATASYRSEQDYFDREHLSPELHMSDPLSRSPSPLSSPRPSNESITFDHGHRRYDIHNEATSELFDSLSALSTFHDTPYLRHALLPLLVLALVSRPSSSERALCLGQFDRFKQFMAYQGSTPNPIGGSALDFDIPWDRLDAYSAEMEQQRSGNVVFVEPQLDNSAPEWNWWYMLKRMDLKPICQYATYTRTMKIILTSLTGPVIAGTMHTELGTEFWAFNVLSACCTDECFAAFMQPPPSATQASSSTS